MNEQQTIVDLAYALWRARGCPEGSAEVDWSAAERQVMASRPAFKGGGDQDIAHKGGGEKGQLIPDGSS